MLKPYKNELLQLIETSGLSITDFSGIEKPGGQLPAFVIVYKPAKISFVTRNSPESPHQFDYFADEFPDSYNSEEMAFIPRDGLCNFDTVSGAFIRWLD